MLSCSPVAQHYCSTEVTLLCRMKNTSCYSTLLQYWDHPALQDRNNCCSSTLLQYWGEPALQDEKYVLLLNITAVLKWTCFAGSKIRPVSLHYCNTEVDLLCRMKNTSCYSSLLQYWDRPALQDENYVLLVNITAVMNWSCFAGRKMRPVTKYCCSTEVKLLCRTKNTSCYSTLLQYWSEPALQDEKYVLLLNITAALR